MIQELVERVQVWGVDCRRGVWTGTGCGCDLPGCALRTAGISPVAHSVPPSPLLPQAQRWEEVYDEVAAHEMELFRALADGSALEQVGAQGAGRRI